MNTLISIIFIIVVVLGIVVKTYTKKQSQQQLTEDEAKQIIQDKRTIKPLSVNYHFDRRCNYKCGFCFHVNNSSYRAPVEEATRAIRKLAHAGMRKINFAGGEPFLQQEFLGTLVKFCKVDLKRYNLAVSIVSNGSLIRRSWMIKYAKYVDVLAVSCDSFIEDVNKLIGRSDGKTDHIAKMRQVSAWCREFNIKFKINSVVCSYNWEEDMSPMIAELAPFRWKCFQVLTLDNQNGSGRERDATLFKVSNEQFAHFCKRHAHHACMVPESNESMQNSYLILDEKLRFLNCQNDTKEPSSSILDVDVQVALSQAGWDPEEFLKRGGVYNFYKEPPKSIGCSAGIPKELEF